ncbi:uncharacterized protein [Dermacentor andersoni]|uniref:uncharacterized protein isoform X2 n=1 Tax=Dermacentor andersoni TaxID=34620 RepID=UPI0021555C06|nr:amyloid-beta precursor protein-like isoform X2 [Dermacentor andersoni]
MRKRTATLCWILLGLGIMCAEDKDKKITKETVKKGSGDPYWCGPKLEEVCYEGDSKEDMAWNVDERDKGKQNQEHEKKTTAKPKEEHKKEDKKPAPSATEKPKVDNSACQKDFDSGPCFSSKPMYYYRKESKKCEMFVYGGCGGNDNRFDTQKACEEKCARG